MLTLLGIVIFAVGILFSIAWHEIGHLVPAKRFGVKVTQYMVGFGPTVWSRRRGETEYGIKAIPLGGYIRMIGMFAPRRGEDPSRLRASSTGPFRAMVDDARRSSLEEVRPGDEHRVFYRLSVPKRVVVMLGGPVMNLVLGAVLLGVAMSGIGQPRIATSLRIEAVSQCVRPASQAQSGCHKGDREAPAAAAGIQRGDVITSFDQTPVGSWDDLSQRIRAFPAGTPVRIGLLRDGVAQTVTVSLARTTQAGSGGTPPKDVSFLGVTPRQVISGRDTLPVAQLPGQLWTNVAQTGAAVVKVPQRMVGIWQAAFGGGQRQLDGPVGMVGVTRIGGELASDHELPFYAKASSLVALLGSVNLALFVFNLIPLLPLDGGHVAGALFEGLRRQLARLRGFADPGPADVARMLPIAYTVAVLLIGMSGLLLYADLVNPIRLRG
jgi:membrane-associated protease RseP (regulator of RpoE activity)